MSKIQYEAESFFPSQRSTETYLDAIREYNYIIHGIGSKYLKDNLNIFDGNICIATTGSDGRLEKSPFSPIELIILHQDNNNIEEYVKEVSYLAKQREDLFDSNLEIKNLNTDLCCAFKNHRDRIFPTRALDSCPLAGEEELQQKYLGGIVKELTSPEGKKIMKRFNDTFRYQKKSLFDEIPKDKSFDLESSRLFYDDNRIKSTKYSHLRPMQYKIGQGICKLIRSEKVDFEFLSSFSKKTIDRLNSMYYLGKLNMTPSQLDDTIMAYKKALYWYHLSEEEYKRKKVSEIKVDNNELKEVTNTIKEFVEMKDIFNNN